MVASNRKFAHQAVFCFSKGRVKVQCKCGTTSHWFEGEDRLSQAEEWYINHTGLKEQKPEKRC